MLLDVNVLLALGWPNHQFHDAATRWFGRQARRGWATCALTQLGFIRLSSNPAFTELAVTPEEAAHLLDRLTSLPKHRYLAELPPPASASWRHVIGHRQTTDVYLAGVARRHGARLATFDGRLAKTPGLADAVHVIG
jgi:toxin-antitoxin system PIN domain toxin